MEFLLNAERDSISKTLVTNHSLAPPESSASRFGFHCARSPQLLESSLQFRQKKPVGNECSQEETQGFMISSKGTQESRPRHVSVPVSIDFRFPEATPVTTTEVRTCPSAGLRTSASLSVNDGGTAKVGKKRSRTSRRAATTVLNTDTSNFRAMVQRFTGITETPFGYSSMNPTFAAPVGLKDWQLLGKPLSYKALLDLHMNSVSHLSSAPDSDCPQQYNSSTFIPFQPLQDCINNSGPKYPQGLEDVRLINSGSVFPTSAMTSSSDRRPTYLM